MEDGCASECDGYSIKYQLDSEIRALQEIDLMHDIAFISHSIAGALPSMKNEDKTHTRLDDCECQSAFAIIFDLFEERILKCTKINSTKCDECLNLSIALRQHFNKEHFNHNGKKNNCGNKNTFTKIKVEFNCDNFEVALKQDVENDEKAMNCDIPSDQNNLFEIDHNAPVKIEPAEHYDNMDSITDVVNTSEYNQAMEDEEQNNESALNDIKEPTLQSSDVDNSTLTTKPKQRNVSSVQQPKPSSKKLYICKVCNVKFYGMLEFKTHKQIHLNLNCYRCFVCNFKCADKIKLTSHFLGRHISESLIRCPVCMKIIRNQLLLARHMNIVHKINNQAASKSALRPLRSYSIKCQHCDEVFSDLKLYKKHREEGKKEHRPKTKRTKQTYECPICHKILATPFQHKSHLETHSGEKKYVCEICGKSFKTSSYLVVHKQVIHSGKMDHSCSICNRKFRSREYLKSHLVTHSGVKKYVCDICGNSFSTSSNLLVHKRSHTGERKYKCHCGLRFITATKLKYHQDRHTGIRNFACDQCDKKFITRNSLQSHKKFHSGERNHECLVCHKLFTRASNMRQHMRQHSNQPDLFYVCDVCGQSFGESLYLQRHMLSHEGEQNMKKMYANEEASSVPTS